MSLLDYKITDQSVQGVYVQSQPDRLTGTPQQNKAAFDAYPALIRKQFNLLVDALGGTTAAAEIPIQSINGVQAQNVQQALAAIQQNLTAYINKLKATTGAAEVGVSTISGISAGNVQKALEGLRTIQITLDSNIKKLMSANGAATVGVNKISGMQAQNVQNSLEELRKAIDDSVSGIIPGGSITVDMLADDIIKILRNKLAIYTSLESLGLTESNATIESIITAMADNTMLAAACGTDGYDAGWIPASYGLLRIQKSNIYHAMVEYQRDIPNAPLWRGYYNKAADTPWSGWVPISTATPSQEHAIVPKNGATIIDGYKNSYSKDQFGHVLVYFSLRFASVPNNNTEIFSLPQSFLPTGGFVVGAACLTMNISFPAMVTAKSDGSVLVSHNVTGYSGAINLHGFLVIDTQQGGAAQ